MNRAVVVGINEYKDERIERLKGAVNDATEVRRRLASFGEFEIADHHFLTDETEKKPTSENIRRAISDLLWQVEACDLSIFYFSGHGLQDGYRNGYIAPCDIQYDEPLVRGIRIQELKDYFLAADGQTKKNIVLILDCCHSGIALEGRKGPAPARPLYDCFPQDEGKQSGRFILASSGKDQESRETRRPHAILERPGEVEHAHGLFTYHLLECLDGVAADKDGNVYLDELYKHIRDRMQPEKEHESKLWGFMTGAGAPIRIAVASKRREIERSIDQVKQKLEKVRQAPPGNADMFLEVHQAFFTLKGVKQSWPAHPELGDFVDRFNIALQQYGEIISEWMNENKPALLGEFPRSLPILEACACELTFDEILRQSFSMQNAFFDLGRVSLNKVDRKVLLSELRRMEQPARQSTSQAAGPQPRSGQ